MMQVADRLNKNRHCQEVKIKINVKKSRFTICETVFFINQMPKSEDSP